MLKIYHLMIAESFIQYLRFERRFSSHTITAYRADLIQFSAYLTHQYEINNIEEANHTIIRSWIVHLMQNGLTSRSVNRKITVLKTFYKFALKQGKVKTNPMLKITSPKSSKRLPVFVDENAMKHLFESDFFSTENQEEYRNLLIIELFYSTGMRLSELLQLQVEDFDTYNNTLRVTGKRSKQRILPMTTLLANNLRTFIKKFNIDGFIFTNKNGKPLYAKFVYNLVKTYLSKITTLDKKSPHVLRHTFATHMLNSGADINAVKEILGHSSLAATQVYTHNTIEKLKNIHKQAHPRA
jgi:integrase/recombinase XerC